MAKRAASKDASKARNTKSEVLENTNEGIETPFDSRSMGIEGSEGDGETPDIQTIGTDTPPVESGDNRDADDDIPDIPMIGTDTPPVDSGEADDGDAPPEIPMIGTDTPAVDA